MLCNSITNKLINFAEEKKPAKEESESEDEDMGFGLFDWKSNQKDFCSSATECTYECKNEFFYRTLTTVIICCWRINAFYIICLLKL